jgi:hypothetical protein
MEIVQPSRVFNELDSREQCPVGVGLRKHKCLICCPPLERPRWLGAGRAELRARSFPSVRKSALLGVSWNLWRLDGSPLAPPGAFGGLRVEGL